jgi:hypothetical protein
VADNENTAGVEDIDLTQFDDAYAKAEVEDDNVPDGKYDVTVEKVATT